MYSSWLYHSKEAVGYTWLISYINDLLVIFTRGLVEVEATAVDLPNEADWKHASNWCQPTRSTKTTTKILIPFFFFWKTYLEKFILYFMKGIEVILENYIACHINKYWINWIIFCNYWWNQTYFVFTYSDISILFLTWIAYFEREGYYKSCTGEVTVSLAEVVSRKEHPTCKIIPQVKSV